MAGLTPPVVGRNAQSVDRNRLVHHESHLLLRSQQRQQVLHALSIGELGILVRILRDSTAIIHHGLDGQGAQRLAIGVEQFHATEALAQRLGRGEHHQYLGGGTWSDDTVRNDGRDALATGIDLGDLHIGLRLVLERKCVTYSTCCSIDSTEVPLVSIE